jgi:lysophospholipase L1-like esterase
MNGGGNDILIPVIVQLDPYRCKTRWYQRGKLSSKCKEFIDDIYVDGVNLLNEMDENGVENIIYLGYYYTKNALLSLKSLKESVDYGNATLAKACENSTINCTFVNPSSVIVNSDIILDGIHPASSGSRKMADLIWPHLEPLL